jgi:phage N-6-adenine-methyltransferase
VSKINDGGPAFPEVVTEWPNTNFHNTHSRGGMSVHLSSASAEWPTPQAFYDGLNAEFGFTLDPCCTRDSAKCAAYFTADDDGLSQEWAPHRVFMNPPYGKSIGKWMHKAFAESKAGALVVCLVPARTDTAWWHDYAAQGEVRFVRGRLKFGGHKNSAPFPSAVVIFRSTP